MQVPSVSLDGYVRQYGIAPTHLKIDVDGAETDVLKGGSVGARGSTVAQYLYRNRCQHP